MQLNKIIHVLIIAGLTACSNNTQGSWSCKDGAGFSCLSTGEADKIIIGDINKGKKTHYDMASGSVIGHNINNDDSAPKRISEVIRKITIRPFIDADGNYHEESRLHIVINKTGWVQ